MQFAVAFLLVILGALGFGILLSAKPVPLMGHAIVTRHDHPPEGHFVNISREDLAASPLLAQVVGDFSSGNLTYKTYFASESEVETMRSVLQRAYLAQHGTLLFPLTIRVNETLFLAFQIPGY